eukprot:11799576-Karenia_brevis.AAC.1
MPKVQRMLLLCRPMVSILKIGGAAPSRQNVSLGGGHLPSPRASMQPQLRPSTTSMSYSMSFDLCYLM